MSAVKSIVAQKGIQDKYLSHNPHHTHFKADYLRHSQFSKMLIKVEPDGYNYDTFQFGDIYTFEIEKINEEKIIVEKNMTTTLWIGSVSLIGLFVLSKYL